MSAKVFTPIFTQGALRCLRPLACFTLLLWLAACSQTSPEQMPEQTNAAPTVAEVEPPQVTTKAPQTPQAPQYQDLWRKIAASNAISLQATPQLQTWIAFYRQRPSFARQLSDNAAPFLFEIVIALEQKGLPLELALLPAVESGFNGNASAGASAGAPTGLWQMIPATGRRFGLRVGTDFDGRRDAMASTEAVLNYLVHLHAMLGQDWLNAVAGYNAGELRIQAAIKANQAKGLGSDFWSLKLSGKQAPTVYKWLALIALLREEALPLAPIANAPAVKREAAVNGQPLAVLAKGYGLSLKQLKALNPGFRTATVPTLGQYSLLLPLDAQWQGGQLSALKAPSYQVKSGDTLGAIAKRHGISLKTLLGLNGLTEKSIIKPGQLLRLE
ncbi:transglycosylase SLT domain-containing protein [Shewanella sedimentimangrovi]|uniref:Transglycosylase SLT domain-containing protein n=1 Tax=Shewanella sedimentimangrovi TaxID=2814293 RepID=A0ABX7R589_9GAMM|nr:transglycosylase SLT domain-containing protein [Shewanella sedimentimangrovi]QSX38437.1 transglycosylase SLT domain-containing protein [Shewanella sedimentimangrovi]